MTKVSVIIPNWNGAGKLPTCLDALLVQSLKAHIVVVDNGSTDGSRALLYSKYPDVEVIPQPVNLGFAGGVNAGIRRAMELEHDFIALLNNDAIPTKPWLAKLVNFLDKSSHAGIATSKMLDSSGEYLDSTGEEYTVWGLPYPRGRREADLNKYDKDRWVFGASGGASLYRTDMLRKIGLFDEDFFAYYEDVDLSFRAQLAGWKVAYVPDAVVSHHIGGTSRGIKGFSTYHTIKNLPWLAVKNVPLPLLPKVLPRLSLAYLSFVLSGLFRGEIWSVLKGFLVMIVLMPKKIWQRWKVQKLHSVSNRHITSIIIYDLPPNAGRLRQVRDGWLRLRRKK